MSSSAAGTAPLGTRSPERVRTVALWVLTALWASSTWLYARAVQRCKREVQEHQGADAALRQRNRHLMLFSRCNTAVVRATDEQALLAELCRIAVEDGGHRMAWVGRAEHDEAHTVRPVTFAGVGEGFLARVRVSWGDDAYGHGTAGTAIRTRRTTVGRDLLRNPDFAVWREVFREYGYAAALAVPLRLEEEVYGVLVIYATEPDAFDSTEVSLLDALGDDISHGIGALRARKELAERRKQAEGSLHESREKYRELVENANSIILRMDTGGRVTFANEFAQRFFGYSEQELVGRPVSETIVPATESTGRDLARLLEDVAYHPDKYACHENENIRKNGERVWIAWTNKPTFDADGRLAGVLCIGNDITRLKRAEGELVEAMEAAQAADRIKSAFLATMSHELRTPLNSIIGFTGILLQGLAGPMNDEQRKQLGMVQGSSRHLLALINDVLDISKIEAGELEIRREPFDVCASLERVVQALMPLARKKGLAVRTEIGAELGAIIGDQRRFEQIVTNLLGNAVKFTERGGVTLRCAARRGNLELSVQDTGSGIPREHFQGLFRPFHQVDTGLTRKHEGTGLGLSICKRLVELMGGRIAFDSTEGVGSTFTVSVPLRRGEA
jgi:PAS domain S-box-containing protein